jgi:cell division protein FtsI (penicillin-binding protein 3)
MALFLVIAGRLVEFQFSDAAAYAAQGLQARLQPVDLPAPRGSILDRNGAVLAGSAEARYVFADPSRVEDPEKTADALSAAAGRAPLGTAAEAGEAQARGTARTCCSSTWPAACR